MKISRIICFLACIGAIALPGCNKAKWYQDWLDRPVVQGCDYNSDFSLKDGEAQKVQIASDQPLIVGCIVSDNEVFTNHSEGLLFGRTEELKSTSRRGLPLEFTPVGGVITAFVKNASGVDTKVMVWTATPGDCPFMDANARGGTDAQ